MDELKEQLRRILAEPGSITTAIEVALNYVAADADEQASEYIAINSRGEAWARAKVAHAAIGGAVVDVLIVLSALIGEK